MSKITADIFNRAFEISTWKDKDKIDFLRSQICHADDITDKYLINIEDDFPELTDHSISHSKMLWSYADIIIGQRNLTPLEAFILHLAFLIHDAGMCYSKLNKKDKIEKTTIYTDYISQFGNSEENQKNALFLATRELHGDFAFEISTALMGENQYLIENQKLREELGNMLGHIAKSHTCDINYIENEITPSYICPNFPTNWKINCQELALILRVCDAAHIDNLRTPKTLKMIDELSKNSKQHWTFQKKLGFPKLSNDNFLEYTTNNPFECSEQKAWWLCFQSLNILDKELKKANEFLTAKGKENFVAKGVKSINNTLQLGQQYIKTKDWCSIDTSVRVSKPAHIAHELGGEKLYGNKNIALRELVQNSIDAINLYRVYTEQNTFRVGEIKLEIKKDDDRYFLIVTDNGIGMNQALLANELLDFGSSYWNHSIFNLDFKGMRTKGFEAIGKYGIGFFSIFMLGSEITVTSWRFRESIKEMKTLEFYDGLDSPPIIREPSIEEKNRVIDRGTSIKILLNENPYSKKGFIGSSNFLDNSLFSMTKFFIPSPKVRIETKESDGQIRVIEPNIVEKLSARELMDWLYIATREGNNSVPHFVYTPVGKCIESHKMMDYKLIDIKTDNKYFGKVTYLPALHNTTFGNVGVVLSNGIKVTNLTSFLGYIHTDNIVSIKRDTFASNIPYEALAEWAKEQIKYIEDNDQTIIYGNCYHALKLAFGLHSEDFLIVGQKINNQYHYMSTRDFKSFLKKSSEIYFLQNSFDVSHENSDKYLIFLNYACHLQNLLKPEDKDKIILYQNFVDKTIKDVWGNFEKSNEFLDKYKIETKYKRKSNILQNPKEVTTE